MQLIGVAGRAGAGKDTIAEWFGMAHDAVLVTFAHAIKDTIVRTFQDFGLTWEHFRDRRLKEAEIPGIGRSPRELAQLLGTEFGRRASPTLWIDLLERRLRQNYIWDMDGYVVVHDVRFDDEADWVRRNGGIIIHVERRGADGAVGVPGHESERGIVIQEGDFLFLNNGTVADLRASLEKRFPVPARAAA